MNDSSIKFVSIFIDSIKNEGCDIIFEYLTSPEKSLK